MNEAHRHRNSVIDLYSVLVAHESNTIERVERQEGLIVKDLQTRPVRSEARDDGIIRPICATVCARDDLHFPAVDTRAAARLVGHEGYN